MNPPRFDIVLSRNQVDTELLTIFGIRTAELHWSLTEDPAVDWLSAVPVSGTVSPGDSQDIQVTFDSTGLGPGCYATTLNIQRDTPEQPLVQVPVTLHVIEGAATGEPQCGTADIPWPMFRHDREHTGNSPFTGPAVPSEKWNFTTEGPVHSSASIGTDDIIYVGSYDGKLYAIGEPDVPDITVAPSSIDFGSVVVGSSSPPEIVTVTNDGSADLILGAVTVSGSEAAEFSIQNDNCSGQTLTPGASATLEIV